MNVVEEGMRVWAPIHSDLGMRGAHTWVSGVVNSVEPSNNPSKVVVELDDRRGTMMEYVALASGQGVKAKKVSSSGPAIERTLRAVPVPHTEVNISIPDIQQIEPSEPIVMQLLEERFKAGSVYTYADLILMAINPNARVEVNGRGLYDLATKNLYKALTLESGAASCDPHVYAVAGRAFEGLEAGGDVQTVVMSGESGAGKTFSYSEIVKFLVHLHAGEVDNPAAPVQAALEATLPIFEAFGNAATPLNRNSSRYGRMTNLMYHVMDDESFSTTRSLVGCHMDTFLLESSRLTGDTLFAESGSSVDEGNFNVLHFMLAGLDRSGLDILSLNKDHAYRWMPGPAHKARRRERNVDDAAEWAVFWAAMETILDPDDVTGPSALTGGRVKFILAACIHLGEVVLCDADEGTSASGGHPRRSLQGCEIDDESDEVLASNDQFRHGDTCAFATEQSRDHLVYACGLLGVEPTSLRDALMTRTPSHAMDTLKTIARTMYEGLFAAVVARVNAKLAPTVIGEMAEIRLLDLFGFEILPGRDQNGLNQLVINFANEELQAFFNDRVFCSEIEFYDREGLLDLLNVPVEAVTLDAKVPPCAQAFKTIQLRLKERFVQTGAAFDPTALLPKETELLFPGDVAKGTWRDLVAKRGRDAFEMKHFAGTVRYSTGAFFVDDVIVRFTGPLETSPLFSLCLNAIAGMRREEEMSGLTSRAQRALHEMNKLVGKLQEGDAQFVRCVLPNPREQAYTHRESWDTESVNRQLVCSGVFTAMQTVSSLYPVHRSRADVYTEFRPSMGQIGTEDWALLGVLQEAFDGAPEAFDAMFPYTLPTGTAGDDKVRALLGLVARAGAVEPLNEPEDFAIGNTKMVFKSTALNRLRSHLRPHINRKRQYFMQMQGQQLKERLEQSEAERDAAIAKAEAMAAAAEARASHEKEVTSELKARLEAAEKTNARFAAEVASFHADRAELEEQRSAAESARAALNDEVRSLESRLRKEQRAKEAFQREVSEHAARVAELEEQIFTLSQNKNVDQALIDQHRVEAEEHAERVNILQEELTNAQSQLDHMARLHENEVALKDAALEAKALLERKFEEIRAEMDARRQAWLSERARQEAEDQVHVTKLEAELEAARQAQAIAEDEKARLEAQLAELRAKRDVIEQELRNDQNKLLAKELEFESALEENDTLAREVEELRESVARGEARLSDTSSQLQERQAEQRELQAKVRAATREAKSLEQRVHEMEALIEQSRQHTSILEANKMSLKAELAEFTRETSALRKANMAQERRIADLTHENGELDRYLERLEGDIEATRELLRNRTGVATDNLKVAEFVANGLDALARAHDDASRDPSWLLRKGIWFLIQKYVGPFVPWQQSQSPPQQQSQRGRSQTLGADQAPRRRKKKKRRSAAFTGSEYSRASSDRESQDDAGPSADGGQRNGGGGGGGSGGLLGMLGW